jgi:hypothetical protein
VHYLWRNRFFRCGQHEPLGLAIRIDTVTDDQQRPQLSWEDLFLHIASRSSSILDVDADEWRNDCYVTSNIHLVTFNSNVTIKNIEIKLAFSTALYTSELKTIIKVRAVLLIENIIIFLGSHIASSLCLVHASS